MTPKRPARPPEPGPALTTAPEVVGGDAILGAMTSGDLTEWARRTDRLWLAYPAADLARHGVVVGSAGSGKTETLLRVAYLAARVYGWQVVFLDAKGDAATQARFARAMAAAGVPPPALRTFPAQPYDGWRGGDRALLNRLMEVSDFSEPYYREMALRVLHLAITSPGGVPGSSGDLLGRLSKPMLRAAYRRRPQAAEIEELAERDVAGVANRYRAFFASLGGGLDGGWAFEDTRACYVLLEGLALKAEAARLGRFFLEDFAHYAGVRKPPGTPVLLVVDEFSALESTTDAAHLFERLRSFGAAVMVSSQGYAGLGVAGDRILDAAETLILHRCAEPEPLIARAGTVSRVDHTRYLDAGTGPEVGRQGAVRRKDDWRVRPNDVRQLPVGEAVVIAGGRAARVQVAMVDVGDSAQGPPPPGPPPPGAPAAPAEGGSPPPPPPGAAPRAPATFIPSPPPTVPGL
ncbi:MAG TPA: hypothetical protein VFW71_16965 [Actinomycetota bacterium]|nr:hypothetical protein [Actinomycetota bacterium]